jgi:hypothetical protein
VKESDNYYKALRWNKKDGSRLFSNKKSAENAVNLWLVLYGGSKRKVRL